LRARCTTAPFAGATPNHVATVREADARDRVVGAERLHDAVDLHLDVRLVEDLEVVRERRS
jgi:hypothetical protein